MNMQERNEVALQKKWQSKYYEKYMALQQNVIRNCKIIERDNKKIIAITRNNREWRLNSIYDPDKAAQLYTERYEEIRDFAPINIFGLSDARIIKAFLKNCNGSQYVVIYEPNIEVFMLAMKEFDLEEILTNEKVYLIVDQINEDEQSVLLENIVTFENRELMMHCILPNYDILYQEKCKEHIEKLLFYSKNESFKKNTEVLYAARLADNILYNMPYIIRGSSVYDLKETFRAMDLGDTPVIIISAGPSLDKNIKELKKAEGKAFIIAVDSALKAMVREGIHFNMAVSVDPRKNPDVFMDERVNQFPYVLASYSIPMIAEKNKNHLFFEDGYGFETFKKLFYRDTRKRLDALKTGGSVATEALSLAIDLGFRNIVFVGQDFAFTEGKGHVSGFEKSAEADKAHVAGRTLTEVEAIDGSSVMTDIQMDSYRKWFEIKIADYKHQIQAYDATEGGAKIHGTTIITLSDVIEKLCTKEIDFDAIVKNIAPAFTEEEQKKLLEELVGASEYLLNLEKRLEEGILAYEELIALEKNGVQNSKKYQKIMQTIEEVNHIEKYEVYMSFVKLYAKEAEYDTAGDIYTAEEMSIEEIATRGKALLEGYVKGCKVCREHMEEILLPGLTLEG